RAAPEPAVRAGGAGVLRQEPVPRLHPEAARAGAGEARPEQQAGVRPAPGGLGQGRQGHPRARAAAHDREGQPGGRAAGRDRIRARIMTGAPDDAPAALRLAVVEDDAELRERILLPALQAAGFEPVGFCSALELYRQWTRAPFDLVRSEEHTSELQSRENLVCRLLLEKKKK